MLREASSAHRTLQNAYRQHKRNFHSLMFMFFINKQSKKNGNVFILCVECVVIKNHLLFYAGNRMWYSPFPISLSGFFLLPDRYSEDVILIFISTWKENAQLALPAVLLLVAEGNWSESVDALAFVKHHHPSLGLSHLPWVCLFSDETKMTLSLPGFRIWQCDCSGETLERHC